MLDDAAPSFETFLVEDVILALGNLRGALAWVAQPGIEPARFRAGLDRLDRQIATLEDRARAICRAARTMDPPADGAAPDPAPAAILALAVASRDQDRPDSAEFRSCRAAGR